MVVIGLIWLAVSIGAYLLVVRGVAMVVIVLIWLAVSIGAYLLVVRWLSDARSTG